VPSGGEAPDVASLQRAYEATKRRVQAERLRFAEIVAELSGEPGTPHEATRRELEGAREYIASLEAALRDKESELARVYAEIDRLGGEVDRIQGRLERTAGARLRRRLRRS